MAMMARGDPQFPLRLPLGLRDRIKAHAHANGRSMNTEIVRILEHMMAAKRPMPATGPELVAMMRERVKEERHMAAMQPQHRYNHDHGLTADLLEAAAKWIERNGD